MPARGLYVLLTLISFFYILYLPTALAPKVMQSPPSVRPSVRPFRLYLSNRLTFGLNLLHMFGSLPWLAED